MARRFLFAVPLLSGLVPLSGQALGLGEIQLRSALNQPFAADIPLALDAGDDPRGIEVRLAAPETFARFGLDRPAFLGDLRFVLEPGGNRPLIRVTSSRPVSEPFVSLLLEVTWPKGRLLREYTVLLDPPTFSAASAPAVAAPAAPGPAAAPRAVARPADGEGSSDSRPASGPAAPGSAAGEGTYGPVRPNETLWVIASSVRPDPSVSVNQVMLALFRANPEAFAGNINRLKAGAILRIPAAGEIAGIEAADAEVRRQMADWRASLPAAATADGARLQLVPPGEASSTDAGRVARLEGELREAQRLLEVRNRELQALQQRLGQSPAATPAPVPATESAPAPGDSADSEPEVALERLPGEFLPDAAQADGAAAGAATAVPERASRPRPERPRAESTGGGLLDRIVGTVFNLWFLGAAALVLLGALFLYRRRAADEPAGRYGPDLRDGPLPVRTGADAGARADDTFIVEEASRTQAAPALRSVGGEAESPLERTISTESGVELDQADVVAEADFHMAYGLYDQAAELLTRALRDAPARSDLRLKLLEVYFIWENRAAFLKEAQTFRAQLPGDDHPDWTKILIMGKQLCPEEAIFAAAPLDAGLDINVGEPGEPGGLDLDLAGSSDEAGLGVDLDLTAARPGPAAGDLLDFDLGEEPADATLRSRTAAPMGGGAASTMETPTVEARYGSSTMETPTLESPAVGDLDFDIGSDSPTTETPTIEAEGAGTLETPTLESAAPGWPGGGLRRGPEGADQTEEINLEDLGLDLTGLDAAAGDLATGGAAADFDVGEFASDDGAGESSVSLLGLEVGEDADIDSTAELRGMDLGSPGNDSDTGGDNAGDEWLADLGDDATLLAGGDDGTLDLPAIADSPIAGTISAAGNAPIEDTAEQPRAALDGLTAESGELAGLDFDLGEEPQVDVEPTASLVGARGRGPDGPTMTEVGTKLDLARAYIDMGDPDGARSILNEVLEEGDPGQRQEARKLLDELAG